MEKMDNKVVTVITPTYNRAEKLNILYKSLCNQSNKEFCWLIVDDGSTDDTGKLAEKWIEEALIDIVYLHKENGGKHTALNLGIPMIKSDLTFIVDSDDYLTTDAIETIVEDYGKIDRTDICGIAYLRQSRNGNYLTNKLVPEDGLIENFCECRYKRNIRGDMAEVWKTKYLKEFPFPEFEGEKFVSEDVVWIQMSKKYKMVFYNKAIYISDYLEDGLTRSRREINKLSPKSAMHRGEVQLEAGLPFKYKCRAMLYYVIYGKFAGLSYSELFRRSKHRLLFVCGYPAGWAIYQKWRK